MAVGVKAAVFWDVTPFSLVDRHYGLGEEPAASL
jgi:hypothetical protein